MSRLVLIDGSSYLYRAFHALPPLTNAQGEPTGALFGVVNMLRATLKERPAYVAFVVDAPGKTFRDDLYADYKANRPSMPDDLRAQVQPMCDIVHALGIDILRIDGVEADDVIGTLALQAAADGLSVTISTGDKDFAQLVRPGIELVNTMSGSRMDSDEAVIAKFGVRPDQIVDLLALMGDTVDNVPGVEKCGPKTAAKWLAEYDSLDGVIANADKIKGKIGDNLRAALPRLPLNRELVTIKTDVPLASGPRALDLREPNAETLAVLYARYGFTQALRELGGAAAQAGLLTEPMPLGAAAASARTEPVRARGTGFVSGPVSAPVEVDPALSAPGQYETILTQEQLDSWIARLRAAGQFAFDTETDSLDPLQADLIGLSVAAEPGQAAYLPFGHNFPGAPAQLDRAQALAQLAPLLTDPAVRKLGQHGKYDLHVMRRHGIALAGYSDDTLLESFVLNSGSARHDMDSLAKRYLGYDTVKYEDVCGKGAKQIPFAQISLDDATRYAAEDADITLRLHQVLGPRLAAEPGLERVYREIEMPLVEVLARIEANGVCVDAAELRRQSADLSKRMLAAQQKATELAGRSFNLDSPKQLQALLFDELKLPAVVKTPKGQPSTNEEALEAIADQHELPRVILEYRGLDQAAQHLHRQAAGNDPPAVRARAHQLPPGRRGHRAAVFVRSQPAEHPDPHRRRPPHPPRLRRPGRAQADRLRLLADRAAHHGAPVRRPGPGRCVRVRRRRAPRHRRRGVRPHHRHRQRRRAPRRQGDQLRPDVRHERVWSCPAARHRPRRGAGLHRAVLQPLPGRTRLHGNHPSAGT